MQPTLAQGGASARRARDACASGPATSPTALPATPVFADRAVGFWCRALIGAYIAFFCVGAMRGYWVHFTDFSVFWAAGRLALAGMPASVYDWDAITQLQPYAALSHQFYYPPVVLLALEPLARLPHAAAAVAWLCAGLAAYLFAVRAILPGGAALTAALAAPPVLFNVMLGQNGLLTAGLLGGALAALDASPITAGILIGLLAYKPHFGLLLPLFLALTARWRVFIAAAATVLALVALTGGLFGWHVFAAYVEAMPTAADTYLGHVRVAPAMRWRELESVYGGMRMLGAGDAVAWSAHIAIAAAFVAVALRLARTAASPALKAASLSTASFAATPYSELADLAILMIPVAFLLRDGLASGLRRWEKFALAGIFAAPLAWLLPLWAARTLGLTDSPYWFGALGPAMCAMLAALILARATGAAAPRGLRTRAAVSPDIP